jgi:hypothetical protein
MLTTPPGSGLGREQSPASYFPNGTRQGFPSPRRFPVVFIGPRFPGVVLCQPPTRSRVDPVRKHGRRSTSRRRCGKVLELSRSARRHRRSGAATLRRRSAGASEGHHGDSNAGARHESGLQARRGRQSGAGRGRGHALVAHPRSPPAGPCRHCGARPEVLMVPGLCADAKAE